MGAMNPDEIKLKLDSTKVMGYREEMKEVRGESKSSGRGYGMQTGHASGAGIGGTEAFYGSGLGINPYSSSESASDFSSDSESSSESWSESTTQSKSIVPTSVPVFGKELSHVQFRSLDEQIFRSMAVLFDQEQRQGVARLVGMKVPASIHTPNVEKMPGSDERTKQYLKGCYEKLPFAVEGAEAKKHLADREENFAKSLIKEAADAAIATKRRLR